MKAPRKRGFTLIELVIVIIVVAIGAVTLGALFSNTSGSLNTNEVLQQSTQYAQECAESVMTTRRNSTFAAFAVPAVCNGTTTVNSVPFARSASLGGLYDSGTCSGHAVCPCPTGGTNNCRDVSISVTSGAVSSSITVLLVNY